jgi:hypothetical protein
MRLLAGTAFCFLIAHLAHAQDDGSSGGDSGGGGDTGGGGDASGGASDVSAGDASGSSFSGATPDMSGIGAVAGGASDAGAAAPDSAGGNSTAAAAVEQSVPPYPPLGEKSALMNQWTPDGILRAIAQNDEGTLKNRWELQQALDGSVEEKNASMTGVNKLISDSRAKMLEFAGKQQNISTLMYADATAGGIVASARAIHAQIPATQQLLSKTMEKQLKSIQTDSNAIKNAVMNVESQYRTRIKAMADTVSSMIAQQDSLFARLAAQQARAMARTSQTLQSSSLRSLSGIQSNISATVKLASSVAQQSMSGVGTARVALGDVQDSLGEIESQYSGAMNQAVGDVQSTLNAQTDSADMKLTKASTDASASIQTSAMQAGTQLSQQLDKLDRNASLSVGKLVDNTTKVTAGLQKSADKTASSTQNALNQATNALSRSVDGVDSQSQLITSDQLKVSQDMQGMLQKQQAISSSAGSGFTTDMAKMMALIQSQMGGVAGQAKSVSQDVVGGTSDESVRLSKALSYLLSQASAGTNSMSAGAQSQLAAQQKAQADLIAQRNAQIGGAGDQLNSALSDASRAAMKGSGALGDRISGMGSTYGGSIDALMATLTDSSSSGSQGLSQIAGALGGKASDAFSSIIETLRGVNNGGVDAQEDFLNTVMGPSRDNSAKGMSQVQALVKALSGQLDSQSGGQQDTLSMLRALQANSSGQISGASQTLNHLRALNGQLGDSVSAAGQSGLADARSRMLASLMAQLNGAKNQSADGLARINQLMGSMIGGSVGDTMNQVGQTMAVAGANLDAGNQNFAAVERDQLKSLSGLSSMAASLLGDSSNAGLAQKGETEASLANAKTNIIAKFKEIAANTTNTDLGKVMQDLIKQGNDTAIVQFLVGDVQTAMQRINTDAMVARDTNDKKRAEFEAYVASTQAELQKAQADIVTQMNGAISQVQQALTDKMDLIQSSQGDMNASLNDIKAKVEQAQKTLGANLAVYREKLDGIIGQIRSYMNMSADADNLAIRNDIAKQMGKVNATEVAIASANAAVQQGLADRSKGRASTGSATFNIVDGVISGAMETESSVSDAHLGQAEQLLAVAANVDASATELDGSVKSAASLMENGIAASSDKASKAILTGEADQAKNVGQLNDRAADVAKQSRKNFVSSLEKMGAVDDDTLRVSKQLQTLLGNADGAITDVSETSMSHLDLSVNTMVKLNQAEVRKVASVSDVMQAFSAVIVGFLNETENTMSTIMNELNSVDTASKAKLKEIDTRSKDEMNWVNTGLNTTTDAFNQAVAQEQIIQSGLKMQLMQDEKDFKASEAAKNSEPSDIQDQVTALKQKVSQHQTSQLSKVRSWIASRNPQVAKALFGSSGSFVQTRSREAIIRDIRDRMDIIRGDLSRLHETK